jgi:hypothetical protein
MKDLDPDQFTYLWLLDPDGPQTTDPTDSDPQHWLKPERMRIHSVLLDLGKLWKNYGSPEKTRKKFW